MKKYLILVMLIGIIFPAMLFRNVKHETIRDTINRNVTKPEIATEEVIATTEPRIMETIRVKDKENIMCMDLEEYVLCVILGEMPAEFEVEALKAQAVATRTYTLRKVLKQEKHEDADICIDASCCQAFIYKTDYLQSKGNAEDIQKIEKAVYDTAGEVLIYQNRLIEATYFSCSGGMTEDAAAVWGTSVPYLKPVHSPGEDNAKYYETERSISKNDFLSALGLHKVDFLDNRDIVFTQTAGNGVETMTLLGVTYTGTQVRNLLSLPSTAFSVTIDGDNVLIVSKGYGHRVGMSQYGADAMAVNGSTYDEILMHYYKGTSLARLSEKQMKAIFDKEWNL